MQERAFAQQPVDALVKPGTKLTYRLTANNKFYDLVATVKTIEPALAYDWLMIDSAGAAGSVVHTIKGVEKGIVLDHRFVAGSRTLNDSTTSLVLSRSVQKKMIRRFGKPVSIFLDRDSAVYHMGIFAKPRQLNLKINGRDTLIAEVMVKSLVKLARQYTATGEEFFTFYRSAKLPLLLRMKIDNGIALEITRIDTP